LFTSKLLIGTGFEITALVVIEEELDDTNRGNQKLYIEKRQYNGQKKKCKRTNNDLQNIYITLKIEILITQVVGNLYFLRNYETKITIKRLDLGHDINNLW
jgi:hypothetical protein